MEHLSEVGTFVRFIELGLFGYFIWLQRGLTQDMKKFASEFAKLKAEHDTYKELNMCPIIKGVRDGDKA